MLKIFPEKFIFDIYNHILIRADVNLAYVESYMEAYEYVKLNENMPVQM
jgi:hypothetical protein